jgi:hypothetical protein
MLFTMEIPANVPYLIGATIMPKMAKYSLSGRTAYDRFAKGSPFLTIPDVQGKSLLEIRNAAGLSLTI